MSLTETMRLVISGDSSGAVAALGETADAAGKAQGAFGKYGEGLNKASNAAAVGVVALTGVIVKSAYDTQQSYSAIKELMRMTGDNAEQASTLAGQWDATGLSVGEGSAAMLKFSKNLQAVYDGSAKANPFGELGVSVKDANGEMRDSASVLADVQAAMSTLESPTQRTAIAVAMFGKSGDDLLNWLTKTPAELDALNKKLKEAGLVWSDKDMEAYKAAATAQRDLQISLKGMEQTIARDVVPAMTPFVQLLGSALTFLRPLAPAVVPLTIALAGFVGVVKGANLITGAWHTLLGWLPGRIGKTIIAEGLETTAIGVNTAAVEANTAAKVVNGGVGVGALPLGAAGTTAAMGGLATMGVYAAVGASAALAIALPIALATYKETPGSPGGYRASGGGPSGIRGMTPSASDMAASRTYQAEEARGFAKLLAIREKLNGIKPSADTVGALDRYKTEIKDIAKAYPSVSGQASVITKEVDKQKTAFDQASQAAADLAKSVIESFSSMAEFIKATNLAAIMGTPLPTAAQAAFASQSDQAAAFGALTAKQRLQMYNANVRRLKNNPPSTYAGTSSHPSASSPRTPNPAIHLHFHGPVVGGKAGMRELSDIVKGNIMAGVSRNLVGQNA